MNPEKHDDILLSAEKYCSWNLLNLLLLLLFFQHWRMYLLQPVTCHTAILLPKKGASLLSFTVLHVFFYSIPKSDPAVTSLVHPAAARHLVNANPSQLTRMGKLLRDWGRKKCIFLQHLFLVFSVVKDCFPGVSCGHISSNIISSTRKIISILRSILGFVNSDKNLSKGALTETTYSFLKLFQKKEKSSKGLLEVTFYSEVQTQQEKSEIVPSQSVCVSKS